jgi:hypothetical protein
VGLDITSVKTLARGTSDHLPILVQATYSADKSGEPTGAM